MLEQATYLFDSCALAAILLCFPMVDVYGALLDTPTFAAGVASFADKPNYKFDDYFAGPSSWLTFNQFFAPGSSSWPALDCRGT